MTPRTLSRRTVVKGSAAALVALGLSPLANADPATAQPSNGDRIRHLALGEEGRGIGLTESGDLMAVSMSSDQSIVREELLASEVAGPGPALVALLPGGRGRRRSRVVRSKAVKVGSTEVAMELDEAIRAELEAEQFDFDGLPTTGTMTVDEYRVAVELAEWDEVDGLAVLSATDAQESDTTPVAMVEGRRTSLLITRTQPDGGLPVLNWTVVGSRLGRTNKLLDLPGHDLVDVTVDQVGRTAAEVTVRSETAGPDHEAVTHTIDLSRWRPRVRPGRTDPAPVRRRRHDVLPLTGLPGYRAIEIVPGDIIIERTN